MHKDDCWKDRGENGGITQKGWAKNKRVGGNEGRKEEGEEGGGVEKKRKQQLTIEVEVL